MKYQISNIKYQKHKPKIKNLKNFWYLICIFGSWFLVFGFCGCATIKKGTEAVVEGAKGIAGISTRAVEEGRKDAIKKTFNYDYKACYAKTEKILKNIGAYIYARDAKKEMIAIFVSEEDTTPVGIFFQKIDDRNTQVEVSSPATSAKELIANKLFSGLRARPVRPIRKKPDAKKP